jgi:hypothetical protein
MVSVTTKFFLLSVIMLDVVMPSVMVPFKRQMLGKFEDSSQFKLFGKYDNVQGSN